MLTLAATAWSPSARAESLLELYEAAHSYDATYLSARSLADSAPFRVEQSRALMRPSAHLSGSGGRGQNRPTVGGNFGSNSIAATLAGRQPLFNRGNQATIAQSERSLESSLADLDTAEQDLMLRVSQAYFDVLGAQDTLQTTRANKAAISEQLASAKRNFEVGTATITDTREAQARFDLATAQEIAADNDLATKRIALDQLVGRTNVAPNQLAVRWRCRATAATPVDELVRRPPRSIRPSAAPGSPATSRGSRPRRRAPRRCRRSMRSARCRAGAARSLPGITGNNTGASVGVQLNMPLYTGGSIQNRIKETIVLEDRAQDDLESARRTVAQATRQAFYTLQSGTAQVRALEAAESSSQLALEATQLGYRVGVRVNLDVLNAQTQLFQTRRDLARARYDVLLDNLRLRQAAGGVNAQDVAEIDRLLRPESSRRRRRRRAHSRREAHRGLTCGAENLATVPQSSNGANGSPLQAAIAAHRFGLGEADLAVVGSDPRAWLAAQIGPADTPRGTGLLDTRQALEHVAAEREHGSWRRIRRPA